MPRLFFAAKIPDFVIETIISRRDEIAGHDDIRWEKPEKLHITLKFLGDVDSDDIPGIKEQAEFIEKYAPIECKAVRFGFFFRKKRPQILWAGIEADEKLEEIASKLSKRMTKFGIEEEKRKFKPHLTLLRMKGRGTQDFVNRFNDYIFEKIDFSINEIILYESKLLRTGSVYSPKKVFKLEEK